MKYVSRFAAGVRAVSQFTTSTVNLTTPLSHGCLQTQASVAEGKRAVLSGPVLTQERLAAYLRQGACVRVVYDVGLFILLVYKT